MVDERLLVLVKGEHRREYARRHGLSSLITKYHWLPWNDEESERVYKICNDKGITWEEYYGLPKKEMIF